MVLVAAAWTSFRHSFLSESFLAWRRVQSGCSAQRATVAASKSAQARYLDAGAFLQFALICSVVPGPPSRRRP